MKTLKSALVLLSFASMFAAFIPVAHADVIPFPGAKHERPTPPAAKAPENKDKDAGKSDGKADGKDGGAKKPDTEKPAKKAK